MKEAVAVTLTPSENMFDALADLLDGLLAETRKRDGCLHAMLCRDKEQNELMIVQLWASTAAHEAYLDWRADRGDLHAVHEYLDNEAIYRVYQAT